MKLLSNVSLRHKLLVMTIIPMIGLLWFAQNNVTRALGAKAESAQILEVTDFAVASSSLVHELQKERGMSAGFLGSGGKKFVTELPNQRKNVDEKISQLKDFLSSFDAAKIDADFDRQLQSGLKDLKHIDDVRRGVNDLSMAFPEAVGYYTSLNGSFLGLAGFLPKISSQGELNNEASAYVAFLQSKERAGIERAVLSNVFSKDAFGPGLYERLNALIVTQDVYVDVFNSLATERHIEEFSAIQSESAFVETQKMRDIAAERHITGGFGIDAVDWFSAQTKKINLLKQMENLLSEDIKISAEENLSSASGALGLAIFIAAFFVGLAIVVGWIATKSILEILGAEPKELKKAVDAIADNNLDYDMDLGEPARGIYADVQIMQENLRYSIESDRQAMRENGRIRQALDNADGNIMIANTSMEIIYMNHSMMPMFNDAKANLASELSGFDAQGMLGKSAETFYKDAVDRAFIDSLKGSRTEELTYGQSTFRVVFNPVFGDSGDRLGTVMEWVDRTDILLAEKEVQSVVDKALLGDLSNRIDLANKDGFISTLSSSVNQLMELCEQAVSDTTRVITSISNGNLTEKITNDYEGSFDELKAGANATVDKLTEVVGNIQGVSSVVRSGASEISQGNLNLSRRTEDQATKLEQTASAMEEMTGTVKSNADSAEQADKLAKSARSQAEQGGEVVDRAVGAMDEINASSKKIADIIGVIDEIAFQTNLLALNASVEAARAGEQGRGFAVVASEVRNLAGRSATAAKEIKDLIQDSEQKVNEGSRLVNESGETLSEIVSGVKKVSDIISEIASASQEQSIGIQEVSTSVGSMDQLTQQNAALVEEAAAASESLGDQADELSSLIDFFKTDADQLKAFGDNNFATSPKPKYGPGGIERRSKDRPWSDSTPPAQQDSIDSPDIQPATVSAAGSSDDSWEEF